MEDNFNQNDFEEFLQDQVRNHRMYPADTVWREIDKKLHGEKRWPALTIAALTLLSATVLICVYFTPKPSLFTLQPASLPHPDQTSSQKNILTNLTATAPFVLEKHNTPASTVEKITADKTVGEQVRPDPTNDPKVVSSIAFTATVRKKAGKAIQLKAAKTETPFDNRKPNLAASSENVIAEKETEAVTYNATGPVNADGNKEVAVIGNRPKAENITKDYNDKNIVDDFLKEHKGDIALHSSAKKPSLKNKFSYQIYVAPSISYRKLLEDNSLVKEDNGGPVALNYVTDVNKVVRHKPGTGVEVGISFMYNLSNTVRLKTGFQFNMRQYSIEAYRSNTELASIALLGNNRIDTVNSLSFYRNNNGYYSAELVNRYYQISVPVGMEWEIFGTRKIHFNVAGTIQPTYLLNRNAYLLSTNFKNYTESPGMVRQWNINSNVEAFMSFKVGDFKWQLGPQLRYQPYSTFIPQYPIKEHLMDYGIKLGVSSLIK